MLEFVDGAVTVAWPTWPQSATLDVRACGCAAGVSACARLASSKGLRRIGPTPGWSDRRRATGRDPRRAVGAATLMMSPPPRWPRTAPRLVLPAHAVGPSGVALTSSPTVSNLCVLVDDHTDISMDMDARGRTAAYWSIPEDYSIVAHVLQARRRENLALLDGDRTLTFGELERRAGCFASELASSGVGHGDRVGIGLSQGIDAATAYLGALWRGAIVVPLSLRDSREGRADKLKRAEATVAVVPAEVDVPASVRPVSVDDRVHPVGADPDGAMVEPAAMSRDDPAFLLFTSGTTGTPRGVLLPQRILPGRLPGFRMAQENIPQAGDRFWTPVEWIWIGSLVDSLFAPWALGVPVVAQPAGPFDPERAVDVIERHKVRNAFLPPTAMRLMSNAGVRSTHPLRALHSGGESLTQSADDWASSALGVRPNEIYGQSEASFLAGSGGENGKRDDCVGKPYPGHFIDLVDDEGIAVSRGEMGEIVVPMNDPVVFLGYWGEPAPMGYWWRTNDLARMDDDGYLRFVSRKDDLIISAGYRVDPVQIEEALRSHPAIAMAAVVGMSDDLRGQVPVAYVTLADGHSGVHEDLEHGILESLRGRVPGYARPRRLTILDRLPVTATGKIARGQLRQV